VFGTRTRATRRKEFVATYRLPSAVGRKLRRKLGESTDLGIAFRGLHQWLRLHVAPPGLLAMPSNPVDQLWHDFILHTQDYQAFCRQAYGRTLHHSPEQSMSSTMLEALHGEGIGRSFAMACADEGIRLPQMLGLPVLFQVNTALAMPDGQQWGSRLRAFELFGIIANTPCAPSSAAVYPETSAAATRSHDWSMALAQD
jgi:hypothetical protein